MTAPILISCGLAFAMGYILGFESAWRKAQREARALIEMAKKWKDDTNG